MALRYLDRVVIETLHGIHEKSKLAPFSCTRAFYNEGEPLYKGAGFNSQDHVQLCVRDEFCIKGYFLPKELKGALQEKVS